MLHQPSMILAMLLVSSLAVTDVPPRVVIEDLFGRATAIVTGTSNPAEAREAVRDLARGLFDGRQAARHALGPEWDKRTTPEREQFTTAFTEVIERAYLELLRARMPRDRPPSLRVLDEQVGEGRAALVRTIVESRNNDDVQVDYVMAKSGRTWRIHDVIVDGISLVENYRAQFARVMRTSSYDDLLARMKTIADAEITQGVAALQRAGAEPEVIVAYFDSSGAELSPGARRGLRKTAAWLSADRASRVVVEGHADQRGDQRLNQVLAERRVSAIRDHLVSLGVARDRIEVVTYGDRRPVCREAAETCWAQNRRAVVRVTP